MGGSSLRSKLSFAVLLLCSSVLILILPRGINSHEPVTTKVRFNKEIVRIFQRHCLACHQSGSVTDISLATYATARPWAKAFKEEVLEKRMPPFQAVKGFGLFHNDYTLTQNEIDQLVAWVDGGTPKGDDKDLPAPLNPPNEWELGQPDLILTANEEPKSSSDSAVDHRCVVLPANLKQSRWISAIDFHPGNESAIHCASFGIERTSSGNTIDCADDERSDDSLGLWLPGQTITKLPENVGRLLPADARIVLRIHYRKGIEPASAQNSLALYFSTAPAIRRLRTVALVAANEGIPAGAVDHRVRATYIIREYSEALSIRPILFPFARSVEVTAYRPDGTTEALIWARDYHYDWQPEYDFKKAIKLPRGTRIEAVAYFDNSDNNPNNPNHPARSVRFNSALCELSFINPSLKGD